MGEVNFYLKPMSKGTEKSLVFGQFKYSKQRLRFSTKQTVDPAQWSNGRQRLKGFAVSTDSKFAINELLDKLSSIIKQCYNDEIKNGIPTTSVFKMKLDEFFNQKIEKEKEEKQKCTFWELTDRFIAGEFTVQGKVKSKNTLANYRSAKKNLLGFSKKMRYSITYESVTLDMFFKLTAFLRSKGLAHNTIAKTICILKVFMNQANQLSLTLNTQHRLKQFSMPEVEVDTVALSQDELLKLYHFDFSDDTRLGKTRDLFLVGALTGLRFSDFSQIKKEQFVKLDDGEWYLKIITKKMKELVVVPVSPVIHEIMKKYPNTSNNLPTRISIQKFNSYIKEACRRVGMLDVGRSSSKPTAPLYSLVCSHTCRRSFCTAMYRAGVDDRTIMLVSGHKSIKSFQKYLKVSKVEAAMKLGKYHMLNASKFHMSVAN